MPRRSQGKSSLLEMAASMIDVELPPVRIWREATVMGMMLMCLSWGVIWYDSFFTTRKLITRLQIFIVFSVIVYLAFLFIRLVNLLRLKRILRQTIMLILLMTCFLAGVKFLLYPGVKAGDIVPLSITITVLDSVGLQLPGELLVGGVILLLWLQGIYLAEVRTDPRDVFIQFRLGFVMFLVFIIVHSLDPVAGVDVFLYLFLFALLISMVGARVSILRYQRGGQSSTFTSQWVVGVFGSVMGLLALILIAVTVANQASAFLLWILSLVWGLFVLLLLIFTTPIILIIFGLLEWLLTHASDSMRATVTMVIDNIVNVIAGTIELLESVMTAFFEKLASLSQYWLIQKIFALVMRLPLAVLGICFIFLLIIILRTAGRRLSAHEFLEQQFVEERGSVEKGANLLSYLRAIMRRRISLITTGINRSIRGRNNRNLWAAARVRQIYARLLRMCEKLDRARATADTPNEFLPVLKALFPMYLAEVELITDVYVQARYGDLPEDVQQLAMVESAWRRLKSHGEQIVKYRKDSEIAEKMRTRRERN